MFVTQLLSEMFLNDGTSVKRITQADRPADVPYIRFTDLHEGQQNAVILAAREFSIANATDKNAAAKYWDNFRLADNSAPKFEGFALFWYNVMRVMIDDVLSATWLDSEKGIHSNSDSSITWPHTGHVTYG